MSFLGWRQWAVDPDGMLRPAWTPWSPYPRGVLLWRTDGPTEALCLRADSSTRPPSVERRRTGASTADASAADVPRGHARVPEPGCVCGLYAWRTPEQLAAAPRPRWTRLPVVTGVVRLGGRVVVAERGYRAERAFPVAVHDPSGVVAATYAAARYRAWEAMVAEWRQPDG